MYFFYVYSSKRRAASNWSIRKTLKYSIHDRNESWKTKSERVVFVACIVAHLVHVIDFESPFILSQGFSLIELVQYSLVFLFQGFELIV